MNIKYQQIMSLSQYIGHDARRYVIIIIGSIFNLHEFNIVAVYRHRPATIAVVIYQ